MKILITGVCGFVGSRLALSLRERLDNVEISGIDNFLRPGSETNRAPLEERGVRFVHGDVRSVADVDSLPASDWVIDAAANPSVLAGVDGRSNARQVTEHNLVGTLNVLEYCRRHRAGLILVSSSRVYSIHHLAALPIREQADAFALDTRRPLPSGVGAAGVSEMFPVSAPISLYGATKLASEIMAIEYGSTFGFPVWVNRCGVLAGAGQFGTSEQGIFSYWIHSHASHRPLRYIGFEGRGYQVRDAFHPDDLAALVTVELHRDPPANPIYNAGGGIANTMSLAQLTRWCGERFGNIAPAPDLSSRPFDIPWLVMDSARAHADFGWTPQRSLPDILDEIAAHARANPDWLARSKAL